MNDAKLVAAWAKDILDASDPNDPDSYYNDHAREFAESIAFDGERDKIAAAIGRIEASKDSSHGY